MRYRRHNIPSKHLRNKFTDSSNWSKVWQLTKKKNNTYESEPRTCHRTRNMAATRSSSTNKPILGHLKRKRVVNYLLIFRTIFDSRCGVSAVKCVSAISCLIRMSLQLVIIIRFKTAPNHQLLTIYLRTFNLSLSLKSSFFILEVFLICLIYVLVHLLDSYLIDFLFQSTFY